MVSADEKYFYESTQVKICLANIKKHSNVNSIFFTINFDVSQDFIDEYPMIRFIRINNDQMKILNVNNCIQHGEFFNVIDFNDDDILIFTDIDAYMQRGLSEDEYKFLSELKENEFCMQWNNRPYGTLKEEMRLLRPNAGLNAISKYYDLNKYIFNTGVIATKAISYKKLYEIYCKEFYIVESLIGHVARQQWFMSEIMQRDGFHVHVLPYTFHSHAHFGPQGELARNEDGLATINGEVVLFAHALDRYV